MAEKSAQEKLLSQDVLKYLTERSYRAEDESNGRGRSEGRRKISQSR